MWAAHQSAFEGTLHNGDVKTEGLKARKQHIIRAQQSVLARMYIVLALRMKQCYTTPAVSMGATWFRRGLQSSAGHTEGWLPRKYTQKKLNCKR